MVKQELRIPLCLNGWMKTWGASKPVPKLRKGDKVAVLSPSFAAPGFAPAVHEQAMARFVSVTGLIPVEYPTTRQLGATAEDRAADLNAAFADPTIRAIISTIGGDDQITVIPHLDVALVQSDPKPFLGYSDNTNLLNWLWSHGISGFYGGSTQVHIGPGPYIDDIHLASLEAALMTGGELAIIDPGESEDFGWDWRDPRALVEFGEREPTEPWAWAGPEKIVSGRTWGGCVEVIDQLALAGWLPDLEDLQGSILLLETSELLPPADWVKRWVRALGERGVLGAVAGILLARAPSSNFEHRHGTEERIRLRTAQRDVVIEEVARYNTEAVVCVGVPFGHTRPQWILPYGGHLTMNGSDRTISAYYG